jgi:hypothetical protein
MRIKFGRSKGDFEVVYKEILLLLKSEATSVWLRDVDGTHTQCCKICLFTNFAYQFTGSLVLIIMLIPSGTLIMDKVANPTLPTDSYALGRYRRMISLKSQFCFLPQKFLLI